MEMIVLVTVIACDAYLSLCLLLYELQDHLLFHHRPRGADPARRAWLAEAYPEAGIEVAAPNGDTLRGWLLKPAPVKTPLVIYFGGIGEEVSATAHLFERFGGRSLLLVNYNGYGDSEGTPSQAAFFQAALAVYDAAAARDDIDAKRIVACGRSMGTGVAVYLAAHRAVSGVVLISPYDSLTRIVRRTVRVLRWLPLSALAKHPFDSLALAPRIHAPLLALAGQQDALIPPGHSQRLAARWQGAAQLVLVNDADHGTITDREDFWKAVSGFLKVCDQV